MRTMDFGGRTIGYYEECDIAPCRACGVQPVYSANNSSGAGYIRCPECGMKTGTSTSGLEGVLPAWNAVMDDEWPASDPKAGLA